MQRAQRATAKTLYFYVVPRAQAAPGWLRHHGRMVEIGRFGRFFSRFLAVKHRIGAYDGLLCSHVVPSTR